MPAKRNKKEKDSIDLMLDQIDFHGMTKDEFAGDNTGNSRNGYTGKSVIMDDNSTVEI